MVQGEREPLYWTEERYSRLIQMLGDQNARGILEGEVAVRMVRQCFDEWGMRNSTTLTSPVWRVNSWDRWLLEPSRRCYTEEDYTRRLEWLCEICDGVIPADHFGGITVKDLLEEKERLYWAISNNFQIRNILNGLYFTVLLPKISGDSLEKIITQWLEALRKSYTKIYPRYKFKIRGVGNKKKNPLIEIPVVEESRHKKLIERLQQGPLVGIYFPIALQGFSTHAAWEQMATLPSSFVLSGLDAIMAHAMYTDTFLDNRKISTFKLGAFYRASDRTSFYLNEHPWEFCFVAYENDTGRHAGPFTTSGLFYF